MCSLPLFPLSSCSEATGAGDRNTQFAPGAPTPSFSSQPPDPVAKLFSLRQSQRVSDSWPAVSLCTSDPNGGSLPWNHGPFQTKTSDFMIMCVLKLFVLRDPLMAHTCSGTVAVLCTRLIMVSPGGSFMVLTRKDPCCATDRDPICNFVRQNWRAKIKGPGPCFLLVIGGDHRIYLP